MSTGNSIISYNKGKDKTTLKIVLSDNLKEFTKISCITTFTSKKKMKQLIHLT